MVINVTSVFCFLFGVMFVVVSAALGVWAALDKKEDLVVKVVIGTVCFCVGTAGLIFVLHGIGVIP